MARVTTLKPRVQQSAPRIRTMQPDSWRGTKQSAAARGYDARWRKYRLQFLAEHPLCVMCKQVGRTEAATVVDHVQPHRGDMALFWEPTNHQALCKPCHDGTKQRQEQRR